MHNPIDFYNNSISKNTLEIAAISKKLHLLSALRIVIFLLCFGLIYFLYQHWKLSVAIGIVGLCVFLYLLSIYTDLKSRRSFHKALISINEEEKRIKNREFYHRPTGDQYQDASHFFSGDIDLFGIGSFFQFINRTAIKGGTDLLARLLLENNINSITKRQSAIKELVDNPHWRQEFSAFASLIKVETDEKIIKDWIVNYKPFISKALRHLPLLFGLSSILVITLIIFSILPLTTLIYWLMLGLIISGPFLKKINNLSSNADKARDTIRQYALLLRHIEGIAFETDLLREQKSNLQKSTIQASVLFKQFSAALDNLDNRNNLIYAVFGNGFFLTDIRNALMVEKWIDANRNKIEDWFEVINFFDAYISLGTYGFNHPAFVYPKIDSGEIVIQAKDLGHPLLEGDKRIDNDLSIKHEEFFIITGANMAGKSTFLRTVSLFILMSNVGLPICAKSARYKPIKLITSMRSTDSLKDESSYFFSELTRLKFIVEAIKTEPYFIVLDEILKGTNSTDKAKGSKKFVERLVEGNATGLIATHDLSLCTLETELDSVLNYYFDAEIIDDELHFDYTFKEGVCKNMNASFLLKKMGIV